MEQSKGFTKNQLEQEKSYINQTEQSEGHMYNQFENETKIDLGAPLTKYDDEACINQETTQTKLEKANQSDNSQTKVDYENQMDQLKGQLNETAFQIKLDQNIDEVKELLDKNVPVMKQESEI